MVPLPHLLRHHPQAAATVATVAAATIGLAAYLVFRKKLTAEEREARRRNRLATHGRIIDGTLIDAPSNEVSDEEIPHSLLYRYRISGVTYECGQNVSALTALLPDLGPSSALFGTPVQVRYDRDNPADSIIIAETWNGLWNQNLGHAEHEHR